MCSVSDRRPEHDPPALRPRAVLVLGSGLVGSTIASEAPADRPVTILSRRSHPELARPDQTAAALIGRELERLDRAAALAGRETGRLGATAVVNCVGLQRGTEDELIAANITWPRWLANDVLAGTGARLVHLGSAAEYGDPGSATPLRETDLARPRGLYGETKWAGSAAVVDAARSGLDAVVARGFNFVGSRLPSTSPLHQFVADVSALGPEGGRVDVWWPDTVRDFILLTDLARAVMALAGAPAVPDLVNVCSGTGISFAEAVMAIAARQRKPVEIISLERPGIPTVIGDNRLMVSTCGFTPVMSAGILAANAGVGEVMV